MIEYNHKLRTPLAFTICANNYLAHAKNLAVSFKNHHPDIKFVIAILDEPNKTIDYTLLGADEILWADTVISDECKNLYGTYGIAELCTVIKPELVQYFFSTNVTSLLYIDPDIQVFSTFSEVFEKLETHDMVLTPHVCSPINEMGHPQDKDLMRTGIYNLGFLAINNTEDIRAFVSWWDKRVKAYGYHDLKKGYFYDQIWLGYGPAFIDRVCVLRHLGYNVANWNLHERIIIEKDGAWYVNSNECALRFFHFSHYKMENEPSIASYNQNFNLENRSDIVPLFSMYKERLISFGYKQLMNIPYVYGKKNELTVAVEQKVLLNRFRKAIKHFKLGLRLIIKGQ